MPGCVNVPYLTALFGSMVDGCAEAVHTDVRQVRSWRLPVMREKSPRSTEYRRYCCHAMLAIGNLCEGLTYC
jgi:hypothetical protein